MQKNICHSALLMLIIILFSCKKNKTSVSATPGGTVFVVGQLENAAGLMVPTIWANGVPQSLSNVEGHAHGIFLDGDDVYVTGDELTAGGTDRSPRVWKNGVVQTLPAATTYASGEQIFVANGKVYVLGYENFSYKSALWINGVKQTTALPEHPDNSGNQNVGLCVVGTDVYTCGVLRNPAGVYKAVLMKNGARMGVDTLANVLSTSDRLFVAGTDIYMTGLEMEGGVAKARLWKNGMRQTLDNLPLIAYTAGGVAAGSDIYTAGMDRTNVPGKIDIVLWKNSTLVQRIGAPSVVMNCQGVAAKLSDVFICGTQLNAATGIVTGKVWKNGVEQVLTDGIRDVEFGGIAVK